MDFIMKTSLSKTSPSQVPVEPETVLVSLSPFDQLTVDREAHRKTPRLTIVETFPKFGILGIWDSHP